MRVALATCALTVGVIAAPTATAAVTLTVPGGAPGYILWGKVPILRDNTFQPYYSHMSDYIGPPDKVQVIEWSRGPFIGEASIQSGSDTLQAEIAAYTDSGEEVHVVGQSMGAMVVHDTRRDLANDPDAPPADKVTFYEVASPQHGIMRYFPAHRPLPIMPVVPSSPAVSQYDTIISYMEYDGFADPPDRPWNLISTANAIAGAALNHAAEIRQDLDDSEVVSETTNSRGATTTVRRHASPNLPLTRPIRWVAPKVADRLDARLRPIVNKGYARHDEPGDNRPILRRGKIGPKNG